MEGFLRGVAFLMVCDPSSFGLAGVASRLDDAPSARGAVALAHALRLQEDACAKADAIPDQAFADHAALALLTWYRAKDQRPVVFRACGSVERV